MLCCSPKSLYGECFTGVKSKRVCSCQLTFLKCPLCHNGGFWTSPFTGALVAVHTFVPKVHQCYSTAVGGRKTGTTGQSRDCKGWAWTVLRSPDCQSDHAFFQFLLETRKYFKLHTGYRHQQLMTVKKPDNNQCNDCHSRGRGIFSRLSSGSLLPEFTSN